MKNSDKFEKVLHGLQDAGQAAEYLNACFDEGPDVFLQALRDVVKAHGGSSRPQKTAA